MLFACQRAGGATSRASTRRIGWHGRKLLKRDGASLGHVWSARGRERKAFLNRGDQRCALIGATHRAVRWCVLLTLGYVRRARAASRTATRRIG